MFSKGFFLKGIIISLFSDKAFVENEISMPQKLRFALGCEENIVAKGENAGYQHFLLFPQSFHKANFRGSLKVGIV